MTNAEKFKTAEERAKEFGKWCEKYKTFDSHGNIACAWRCVFCSFAWLDLEAEKEKPLPCPYCGGECKVSECGDIVYCVEFDCKYSSGRGGASREENIAAHNRVARAMIEAAKKEETP